MKNNKLKKSFAQFAGKQLSTKQVSQIKGGNDGGSSPGGDPDAGVVVVDVVIL